MQSLWMLASALLFALMAACVKLAAARYGTAEIVFFRSVVGVVLLFTYTRVARPSLATSLAGMHRRRSVMGVSALGHVRGLGRLGEPEWRTVFFFSLCGCALGLSGTLLDGFTLPGSADDGLLLLAVGICATLAQLTMTRAYGKGRTVLTANLQFSAIVFTALLGTALFGDVVAPSGWLGIGTIIASCIAATALVARRSSASVIKPTIATADK